MKIFVAIDDTDNIESRGTGALAEILSDTLEQEGWGKGSAVTRHQMLIHPDIPYTTHNSSMCFTAEIKKHVLDEFILFARDFIKWESASGSDPGLCIAIESRIKSPDRLMYFGKSAKQKVLKKEEAWEMASLAAEGCSRFLADDEDEYVRDILRSCYNCRYRRWSPSTFICLKT